MRRFRRSIRRGGTRRKKSWASSFWTVNGANLWNSGVTPQVIIGAAAWHKVPAGVPNTVSGDIEPVDQTHLRSLVAYTMGLRFSSVTGGACIINVRWCFGLIAWDFIADTVPALATIPFPGTPDDSFDWIYNSQLADTFSTTVSVIPALAILTPRFDLQWQTRAKRKLSAGTGILAVWSLCLDQVTGVGINQNINWAFTENTRSLFALP